MTNLDQRLFYPATERNQKPITDVLAPFLKQANLVLEIASGSGEHCAYWARVFPHLKLQPSDIHEEALNSINAWKHFFDLGNILNPLPLNVMDQTWPETVYDGIIAINLIHISPWACTAALMEKAQKHLKKGGFLYLYGPYRIDGQHTAPSNHDFDGWLKEQDPRYGVRDLSEVVETAQSFGLILQDKILMPANNFSLVFIKD